MRDLDKGILRQIYHQLRLICEIFIWFSNTGNTEKNQNSPFPNHRGSWCEVNVKSIIKIGQNSGVVNPSVMTCNPK